MPISRQKFLILLFLFFIPVITNGAVVVSEIAWMGTENNWRDEWMELYNNSQDTINLDGWILEIVGSKEINLQGKIKADSYYLIERTNDDSVPGIAANLIFSFGRKGLKNNGAILILKNNSGTETQRINAEDGWPAGDNSTKQTMQWNGSSWFTAEPTPKAQNFGIQNAQQTEQAQVVKPTPPPETTKPAEEVNQAQQAQTVTKPQPVIPPTEPASTEKSATLPTTKNVSHSVANIKDNGKKEPAQQENPSKQIISETTTGNQKQAEELDKLKQTIDELQQKIQKMEPASPSQQSKQKGAPSVKPTLAIQKQTASVATAFTNNSTSSINEPAYRTGRLASPAGNNTLSIKMWLLIILGIGVSAGAGSIFIRHQNLT